MQGSTTNGPEVPCGGIEVDLPSGVRLSGKGKCPTWVKITPKHSEAQHQPGSGTYVEQVSQAAVKVYVWECGTRWFLFLPVGTRCRLVKEETVSMLPIYTTRSCGELPAP